MDSAEGELVFLDVLGVAVDHAEGPVVARVEEVGGTHHSADGLVGLGFAVEDEWAASGLADGGGVHGVAGESSDAGLGLDQQSDAAGRVSGQVDDADAFGEFVAVVNFGHWVGLDRGAGPLWGGPVVDVRLGGVLALVRVDGHGHVGEGVEVLDVVPVGVGHEDEVDVGDAESAGGELLLELDATADVCGVDEDAASIGLDQDHGAEGGRAGVGAERVAGEEDVYGCHF